MRRILCLSVLPLAFSSAVALSAQDEPSTSDGATNICYGPIEDSARVKAAQAEAAKLEAEMAALEAQWEGEADEMEATLRAKMREARMIRDRDERLAAAAEVVPLAEQLYEVRPDVESLRLLTETRLLAKMYSEARESAETWARWRPEDHLALLYLGQTLISLDEHELALTPLRRSADVARDDQERERAGRSEGFALEKLKRYPEALAVYESVGDETSVERVRESQQLEASVGFELGELDDGNYCPDWRPTEEAQRLEEPMEAERVALEEGGDSN